MKYKALVIGCGNIGAEYDLHNKQVQTHAKAFHLRKDVSLTLADTNIAKAKAIAKTYKAAYLKETNTETIAGFDIASICVSTPFHFHYLSELIALNTPLIICEKPVVNTLAEIAELKQFDFGQTKILINYIRRFQPGFQTLKKRLGKILETDKITAIQIRYQRGFMNNCGHALDLLEFLLEREISLDVFPMAQAKFDVFENDPTITGTIVTDEFPINITGFTNHHFGIFEVDIYTADWHIAITESGNTIKYSNNRAQKLKTLKEATKLQQNEVLNDYMMPVIDYALATFKKEKTLNFASALSLNERILKSISQIKK